MAVGLAVLRVLEREGGFSLAKHVACVAGHSPPRVLSLSTIPHACYACVAARCKRRCPSAKARWLH
jgi:Fe-S-cluster-containing dehydrogenase component